MPDIDFTVDQWLSRQPSINQSGSVDSCRHPPIVVSSNMRSPSKFLDPLLKLFSVVFTSLNSNWWHLGMAGELPDFLCPEECCYQQDFVGLDYYWGINNLHLSRIQQLLSAVSGKFDNAPVWPSVLYSILNFHAKLFPGQDILIVENGCVDVADGMDRGSYLRKHLSEVQRAQHDGVNVVGYICWSITSNREWGLSFSKSSDFGLYHIELDTDRNLERVETEDAKVYRDIILRRSINP